MYYVDALLIRLLADNHPSAIAIRLARSSTEDLSQIRHSLNLLTNPYTHIYHIYTTLWAPYENNILNSTLQGPHMYIVQPLGDHIYMVQPYRDHRYIIYITL